MRILTFCLLVCLLTLAAVAQNKPSRRDSVKIEGIVADFFGVPWADARIKLVESSEFDDCAKNGRVTRTVATATTDAKGYYKFENLPSDRYYEVTLLRMLDITYEETKKTGLALEGRVFRIDFGVEILSVTDCRYGIIGKVTDSSDKPVKDARVSAFSPFGQR